MENTLFIIIVVFIGITLTTGVGKFWYKRVYTKLELEKKNLSWSIYLLAQLLSFAIIYSAAFDDILLLKTIAQSSDDNTLVILLEFGGFFLLIVTAVYATIALFTNLIFKVLATDVVGIYEELKENNWTSALIVAGILLACTYIAASQMDGILHEWMPDRGVERWF